MKPFIGISASVTNGYLLNDQGYGDSIVKAGGIPIILPPLNDIKHVAELLTRIDGLIISGGQDVSPMTYQEDPHPACTEFSDRRDAFEAELYRQARDRNMPILAVCRGFQLINVIHGGSLFQDIVAQRPDSLVHVEPKAVVFHRITTEPDSFLRTALGETSQVNSIHHQAIKQLGDGLQATAYAADGIIEGFETNNVIAVQFHPERMSDQEPFLKLFLDLIRRAQ